ncbi:hypothetical protein QTP88_000612 [Uroleucon formosanum]
MTVEPSSPSPVSIKKGKPTVSPSIRMEQSAHQPTRSTRRRCTLCSTKDNETRTNWKCSICDVPLCLGKNKTCFVLSLPSLTHSQMFYLRQLSCYNLGVHFGDSNRGHMFLWHEGMSGRGGNEIASCVFEALNSNPTVKRKLTIWSDNCVGQNKNKMLLFLWIYLTLTDKFDEINHKYLVSGHSFLSCDRDFAQIEKRKRVEKCEVPMDLVKLIVHATPNNPFIVTLLEPNNFYDFKKAADMYLNTGKLQISKCSWLKITKDKPGVVQTKTTFNELEAWSACKVIKKGVTVNTIKEMDLPSLVCENKNISVEKKKDLQQMLPFLKEENKEFFEKLIK